MCNFIDSFILSFVWCNLIVWCFRYGKHQSNCWASVKVRLAWGKDWTLGLTPHSDLIPGTTWARWKTRDQWRRPPEWKEEEDRRWLGASLASTQPHSPPPAFNSALVCFCSYLQLPSARMMSQTVAHLWVLSYKKCFFFGQTDQIFQTCLASTVKADWDHVAFKVAMSGQRLHWHIQADQGQMESISALVSDHIHSEKILKMVN